jgi:hypothetical protein
MCDTGFEGNGTVCVDVDECAVYELYDNATGNWSNATLDNCDVRCPSSDVSCVVRHLVLAVLEWLYSAAASQV